MTDIDTLHADPPVASLRPMPTTAADLTPAWLTAAFQSNGLDVVVSAAQPTPFAEGTGMLSLLVRVELEYARGAGPASVIAKMPIALAANRETAVNFHCYEREVGFYRHAAHRTRARTPIIHFADIEGDSEFVVVM